MDDPREVAAGLLTTLPHRGDIAFAYGQGSAFAGFAGADDIDLVVVWRTSPNRLPDATRRFEGPDFCLDKSGTPKADVMHFELDTFTSWCAEVERGEGWRGDAWPLPLHVVAGFVHGEPLLGSTDLYDRMRTPTDTFVTTVVEALRNELDAYLSELHRCAARQDDWLFNNLTDTLIRHCYIAWFATEGHYLPHPKHLHAWIHRLNLSPDIARLEPTIWTGPLDHRTNAIETFARRILNGR